MTGVLIRRGKGIQTSQDEGHAKTAIEIRMT